MTDGTNAQIKPGKTLLTLEEILERQQRIKEKGLEGLKENYSLIKDPEIKNYLDSTEKRKGAVVSVSGGADSTTVVYMLAALGYEVQGISFDYGQNNSKEVEYAKHHCALLNIPYLRIDVTDVFNITKKVCALTSGSENVPRFEDVVGSPEVPTLVPGRNLIFMAISATTAESTGMDTIALGIQAADSSNGYYDVTESWRSGVQKVLDENRNHPIKILAPIVSITKSEIIRIGLELGLDYQTTMSCYKGTEPACGECGECIDNRSAFQRAGLVDDPRIIQKVELA